MKRCNQMVEPGRRQFLRGSATAAVATVAANGPGAGPAEATPALARQRKKMDLLTRCQNAVFHYSPNYIDQRMAAVMA